jgi:hypothetical protein
MRGDNSGNRKVYGVVAVFADMVHRLFVLGGGKEGGISSALFRATGDRCWGL